MHVPGANRFLSADGVSSTACVPPMRESVPRQLPYAPKIRIIEAYDTRFTDPPPKTGTPDPKTNSGLSTFF
jgi:hypothetical protein